MVNVFLALWAGHMVGDFALQTGRIAEMKRVGWQGLFLHVAMVTAATLIFVVRFPHWLWLILVVSATHLLIDAVRTFIVRDLRRTHLAYFLADQGAHLVVLLGLSIGMAPERYLQPASWIQASDSLDRGAWYVIAVVALVFMVPVMEALLYVDWAGPQASDIQITSRARLLGAIERLTGLILMLSPWPLLAPLVFVPHLVYRLREMSHQHPSQLLRPGLSLGMTLIIGWLLRTGIG